MAVGANWARLSILETAGFLGLSHTVSRVYLEWCEKPKNVHFTAVL